MSNLPIPPVIPDTKVNLFQYGAPAKLSAFEKAQKEAEEKKRRDEEEARAVYDDFVKSFEGDQRRGQEFVGGGGPGKGINAPKRHFAPSSAGRVSVQQDDMPQGKKRNLDTFLEELKRGHDTRDKHQKRLPHPHPSGTTTPDSRLNAASGHVLVVANLPPTISPLALHTILAPEFSESVTPKITLRPSRHSVRDSTEAELNFGSAKEISAARHLLEGYYLGQGYFAQPLSGATTTNLSSEKSYYGAQSPEANTSLQFRPPPTATMGSGAGAFTRVPPPSSRPATGTGKAEIRVHRPRDIRTRRRIHSVVENVLKYGPEFESLLMQREIKNVDYAWLWPVSPLVHSEAGKLHLYYRWKVWCALSHQAIDHAPKPIFASGTPYRPPPPISECDTEGEDEPDQDQATIAKTRTGVLGPRARQRLGWLIRRLDASRRGTIAAAMAFCLERADAAGEIVEVLCAACCSPTASPQVLLGRLFLVSDVLHNSSAPIKDAWRYRAAFEESLGRVFGWLGDVYRGFEAGRIKAKTWEGRVLNVIEIWEGWMMFSAGVLGGLRGVFRGEEEDREGGEGEREVAAGVREAADGVEHEAFRRERKVKQGGWKSLGASPSVAAEEDVQGVDRVPVDLDDVDGAPLDLDADDDDDENIDGVPLDLDLDDPDDEEFDMDGQHMSISDDPVEPTPPLVTIPVPVPAPTPTPSLSLGGPQPGGIKLGLGGKAGVTLQLGGISKVKKVKASPGRGIGRMFGDGEDGE
ncbi:hypothetical protein YB2330_006317 [Saitoella coloradoensis]